MFLKTVGEAEATRRIAELYGAQKSPNGFVTSAVRCWTARPDFLPITFDVQIGDIALCASFRCFVSRFFDAVGAGTESAFRNADTGFRNAMTVGKAI